MKTTLLLLVATLLLVLSCGGENSDASLVVKGSASAREATKLSPRAGDSQPTYGSATSVKVTLYGMYISASTDCSDPVQVADFGASGSEFELFDEPTLIEDAVEPGTYPCIILETSDIIGFRPDQASEDALAGICDTSTDYSFDAYRTGEPETDQWIDLNGDPILSRGTVGDPVEDHLFLFASTDPAAAQANGESVYQAFTLDSALVVPGQTTFYIDASDRISAPDFGGTQYCWMEGLEMGFR
jgi:hypothetical protein